MKSPNGSLIPLWLETIQWIFRPMEFMEARAQRYGDIFRMGNGQKTPVVYLSHPQAIKELFTAESSAFDCGRSIKSFTAPILGEYSLVLLDGVPHQRQRRLLMPPFHGERIRVYGQIISDITQEVIERWPVGQAFSIRPSMQEISLGIILQAVFGLERGERFEQLRRLLVAFIEAVESPINACMLFFPSLRWDLGTWSPWGRFLQLRQQIDQLLYSEIEQRRQQLDPSRTDILTLLLMARDEAGEPMTDGELRDELLTFLVAGHETTASALTWALYWIHALPEVKSKLLSEIESLPNADPSTEREAIPQAIAKLPYLAAICHETLRIYPIAINAVYRVLNAPLQIMGYQFAPGTVLIPCIYLTHHREDVYPEPKQFKPERFLERQFSPYEYFPFGGGNRRCIGMALALFEMKLVVAAILRQTQLSLADEQPIKPVRRGLSIAPSDLRMIVTKPCEKTKQESL